MHTLLLASDCLQSMYSPLLLTKKVSLFQHEALEQSVTHGPLAPLACICVPFAFFSVSLLQLCCCDSEKGEEEGAEKRGEGSRLTERLTPETTTKTEKLQTGTHSDRPKWYKWVGGWVGSCGKVLLFSCPLLTSSYPFPRVFVERKNGQVGEILRRAAWPNAGPPFQVDPSIPPLFFEKPKLSCCLFFCLFLSLNFSLSVSVPQFKPSVLSRQTDGHAEKTGKEKGI
mmetsp:Transcript_27055/g.53083  ORF Transcript_27055/g.53083 Transcript_27055/m.53083 type:complete len:227 (+) Transcript_27055:331-1011(+)